MRPSPDIIILTGLAGSGKSTAINALEDAGFHCIDNMPCTLLPKFMDLPMQLDKSDLPGLAFVMDARERRFVETHDSLFADLRAKGYSLQVVFLEAEEGALLTRFNQTRRHHPLAGDSGLTEGLAEERRLMAPVREQADLVIDTTGFTVHELKERMKEVARSCIRINEMHVELLSFGFKYGLPRDLDLVMDVRFLPNPYFVPELRELTGKDKEIRAFVLDHPETVTFLEKYTALLDYLLPLYKREGKAYLRIGIGCTGGRHRSVAVTGHLFEFIKKRMRKVGVTHRDITR